MTANDFDRFFRRATGTANPPYPFQTRLALGDELPELLDVPTGCGKTAAVVLAWLYRRRFHPVREVRDATPRRLVYCLPMRVLVEQVRDNVVRWLRNLDLHIETLRAGEGDVPGGASPAERARIPVYTAMGGDADDEWTTFPEREAVIVGTQDMLVSRALNRGYAQGRFRWPATFGVINNDCLWVLDEVQLMGASLTTTAQLSALRAALGTFGPTRSLWMSATIDPRQLTTVDHPTPAAEKIVALGSEDRSLSASLVRRLDAKKALLRSEPKLAPGAREVAEYARAVAKLVAEDHARDSGSGALALVVMNTVARAAAVYRELVRLRTSPGRGKPPQFPSLPEPLLIHSRFRPRDRAAKVDLLLAAPPSEGRVVVSTQVVEAGVDVSAKRLYTELAPWPSLVQRFGRCNRAGEFERDGEAVVRWFDFEDADEAGAPPDSIAAPYSPEELVEARRILGGLADVGPARLPAARPPRGRPHVLRRRDLLELFDTSPDLFGNDVDVARFVRETEDRSLHVFWRDADDTWRSPAGERPPQDLARPRRDELCTAPIGELRNYLKRTRKAGPNGWVWDAIDRTWDLLDLNRIRPGLVVLLRGDRGGYTAESGWDADSDASVSPLEGVGSRDSEGEEALGDDSSTKAAGIWLTLAEHSDDVLAEARELTQELDRSTLGAGLASLVERAARWHDAGKAHPVFQETMLRPVVDPVERSTRENVVWAKSPHRARHKRPFRHELASALALLANTQALADLDPNDRNLVVYLVAAHHGRIRVSIRSAPGEAAEPGASSETRIALGVVDGEELAGADLGGGVRLPTTKISLAPMEMGSLPDGSPSWTDRALRLRDRWGPFRLAYLEALLIAADWRGSAKGVDRARSLLSGGVA